MSITQPNLGYKEIMEAIFCCNLTIYGLLKDAVSSSYYVTSNERMINKLERLSDSD